MEEILKTAFALFLLIDAFGNLPIFIAVMKHVPAKMQKRVIVREFLFALAIFSIFILLGDSILYALDVKRHTLLISGGIILFIIALKMIFPKGEEDDPVKKETDPFLFPLAIPMLAGPAVLAALIIYSHTTTLVQIFSATFIAWLAALGIMLLSGRIASLLGRRGLNAMERLMGLILTLLAIQMFLHGMDIYLCRSITHCK